MSDRPHEKLRRLHSNVVSAVIRETRTKFLHDLDSPEAEEATHAANAASQKFWAHIDQLERDADDHP